MGFIIGDRINSGEIITNNTEFTGIWRFEYNQGLNDYVDFIPDRLFSHVSIFTPIAANGVICGTLPGQDDFFKATDIPANIQTVISIGIYRENEARIFFGNLPVGAKVIVYLL